MVTVGEDELRDLAEAALRRAGAGDREAEVLAEAAVEAELVGNRAVGVAHLFDYLDSYRAGRISAGAAPEVRRPAPAVVDVDARGGLAQVAFTEAQEVLTEAVGGQGLAALWIRNSFTCGELGYYPRRLAQDGYVAVAAANSPALMSVGGAPASVLGTNPLAYAVPRPGAFPLVIDQASSSTAYVTVRRLAEEGQELPAGWALGPDGEPTQDAAAALAGTLLPFGGHRGGNVALLVELLATLSGGAFSTDAPAFDTGDATPGIGVFVLAVDPDVFPGSLARIEGQLTTLRNDHGVRLPALELAGLAELVEIDEGLLDRLRAAGSA